MSLLEVVIATALLSGVLVTVTQTVSSGASTFSTVGTKSDLERAAHAAVREIANDLRCAVLLTSPTNDNFIGETQLRFRAVRTLDQALPSYESEIVIALDSTTRELVRTDGSGVRRILATGVDAAYVGKLDELGLGTGTMPGFFATRIGNTLTIGVTLVGTPSNGEVLRASSAIAVHLRNGHTTSEDIAVMEAYQGMLDSGSPNGISLYDNYVAASGGTTTPSSTTGSTPTTPTTPTPTEGTTPTSGNGNGNGGNPPGKEVRSRGNK